MIIGGINIGVGLNVGGNQDFHNRIMRSKQNTGPVYVSTPEDVFVKSPNFKSLQGNKNFNYVLDSLIKTGKPEELEKLCELEIDKVIETLPKIKFKEEAKQNIMSLLGSINKYKDKAKLFQYWLFDYSIKEENVPLLKAMIQDDNWKLFKKHPLHTRLFKDNQLPIIRKGQKSENTEIKELFSGKNLYNLLKQNTDSIYATVNQYANDMFDLGLVYLYENPDPKERAKIAENIAGIILHNYKDSIVASHKSAQMLSELPLTQKELKAINHSFILPIFHNCLDEAIDIRVKKIIQRNGAETPEQILSCLNDRVMSPELLTTALKGASLLDRIVRIPVTEKSKPVISQIVKKLSEMPNALSDNNDIRNLAIIAAKNGNAELLKFFDSRHIHFANNLSEPVNKFPEEVRDILKNAKINDSDFFNTFVVSPYYIQYYFNINPNIDINSKDRYGDTLLSIAIKNKSLGILKELAERDDVDWNITNSMGDNILMQLIDKPHNKDFTNEVIKLLRELPKGKFNINYVNTSAKNMNSPYSALSKTLKNRGADTEVYDSILDKILAFPDIDPNTDPVETTPLIFKTFYSLAPFKKFFHHPKMDRSLITDADFEKLKKQNISINWRLPKYLDEQIAIMCADKMVKLYEQNGMLDLAEIEEFVTSKNFASIADTKFNVFGENIAHLLVDIFPDINNPAELNQITRILGKLQENHFDFSAKDELDRTPLDKAIEGDNKVLADLLKPQ